MEKLHGSLGGLRRLFMSLSAPDSLTGVYRAEFVGPAWLRALAPPSLALGGLAGWWGKAFDGRGGAVNIVVRDGAQRRVLRMTIARLPSLIDRASGLTLSYPKGSPFPWVWIVDEARRLDEQTLLCMTVIRPRGLRKLAFPFVLHFETPYREL
jgi:hypothetical protein